VDEVSGFLHVDQNFTKSHTTFPAPEAYDAYLKGLYHQSKELWSEQKLAIAYFREAVRADSTFSRALVSAAHSQVEAFENGWSTDSGLIQSAGTYCSLAMRLDSLNANAYAVQGTIESNKGNDAEGIRLWQKAAALDPNNALAVTQLAFHYLFYFNEPAKGTLFLEKLRNVDPSDWLITSNVGIGYAQLKNYPEATYWLRRALTLNPKNGLSWNNLGYIYERGEAYDSAISCYKKALVLSPGNFTMYENTISLLLFQRQYASAESVATEARTFLPNHHELLYLAGVLRQQSDRQSEAVTAWKEGMTLLRARRLNGQPTPVWDTDESLFLARLGRREESISKLSKALNADSSDSEVIIKAARIYSVLGIKDRVLYYFQRARQMNPEYDLSYLRTAVDFEFFRNDGDLQALARLSN
jgi:tetratricopeptide (TPR) repeat protein